MLVTRTNLIIIASILLASCAAEDGSDSQSSTTNNAPVLGAVSAQYTNKNVSKNITLLATDPDNDDISYEASSQSVNVTLSVSGNVLTVTPSSDWSGSSTITVEVSDGTLSDSESFALTVLEVSKSPSLTVNDSSISTPPAIPTF